MHAALLLAVPFLSSPAGEDDFDWKRDRIVLVNGREERGLVIEAFDPEHVVVMRSAGSRDEIPREKIQSMDLVRDRLAAFLRLRRQGLSLNAEWSLVEDAQRVGLTRMARLQAYHVLTRDPEHAGAHEFLGHKRASDGWKWVLDEKRVDRERFDKLIGEWSSRLVLHGEHFRLETDCGLQRALDVLFDLETLYVWWMQHLGPELRPAEDVDDVAERMTFELYKDKEELRFPELTSEREPYYFTSRSDTRENGSFNVVRTYYTPEGYRPERLFELASESFVYSLLVLGKSRTRPIDDDARKPSAWVERGLGDWVAQHCGGKPGYVEMRAPFQGDFVLDPTLARLTLEPLQRPHPLFDDGIESLVPLITLTEASLSGNSSNVPLTRARVASFVAYLIEADPRVGSGNRTKGSGRAALWRYLRDVYGTAGVFQDDALFDDLDDEDALLGSAWKSWAQSFIGPRAARK